MVKRVEKPTQESKVVYDVEVRNPKEVDGKKGTYRFTLIVNGVTLYGVKSISYTDETGTERSFIAFPGYKGNNDKYYNNFWFPISRQLQEEIEKQIGEKLP